MEGPRFSSKAESHMFRQWGCDVINMTTVPEVSFLLILVLSMKVILMWSECKRLACWAREWMGVSVCGKEWKDGLVGHGSV